MKLSEFTDQYKKDEGVTDLTLKSRYLGEDLSSKVFSLKYICRNNERRMTKFHQNPAELLSPANRVAKIKQSNTIVKRESILIRFKVIKLVHKFLL